MVIFHKFWNIFEIEPTDVPIRPISILENQELTQVLVIMSPAVRGPSMRKIFQNDGHSDRTFYLVSKDHG